MTARRSSTCASCFQPIEPGTTIGQPQVRNREGGNRFASAWYCEPCALDIQELGESVPYADVAAIDADRARREPILERMRRRGWSGARR